MKFDQYTIKYFDQDDKWYSLVPNESNDCWKENVTAENDLNIGDRALGFGLNIKFMDIYFLPKKLE